MNYDNEPIKEKIKKVVFVAKGVILVIDWIISALDVFPDLPKSDIELDKNTVSKKDSV